MTVKISSLSACPSCNADLTPDPRRDTSDSCDVCYDCGRKVENPTSRYFQDPKYLSMQRKQVSEDIDNRLFTLYEKTTEPTSRAVKTLEDAKTDAELDLVNWLRECSTENKLAPLYDSMLILENILFSVTPPADIGRLVAAAKKIGNLANAIEQYFKAGGRHYDQKVRPTRPDDRESPRDEATATASRNPRS